MAKIKSAETLSLDKTKQKTVAKQTKNLKKKIQDKKITVKKQRSGLKRDVVQNRGLVYIAHIPHGFYEIQMKSYFQQFGAVTNIKLCRSRKNGKSKGFGYVEFSHADVAKIAAESMNNYLMFKKRIVAHYVPYEKRPKGLFKGKGSTLTRHSSKVRRQKQIAANLEIDPQRQVKRSSMRLLNLNKKLQRLKNAGIDYDFEPVHVPEGIKQEKFSDENVTHTYQADPYDSDIELKVPLKKTKKSVVKTEENSLANQMFLAKSLDSVKALLSTKKTRKQVKNKSTSVLVKKNKKELASRGITKKNIKSNLLNTDTVKKIARELIRKRGDSLLNITTTTRKKVPQKKSAR